MKNGPPANAVMMPTGSSDGETNVLANVSAIIKNAPPTNAAAGMSRRWSAPKIRRTACGTTIPMKPIMPLTETTAPVINADTRKMYFLVRSVSIPSDRADSSPNAMMFNTLTCLNSNVSPTTRYNENTSNPGYVGAVSEPINQVIMPKERFGSMIDVTNMISAEKIALRITPANHKLWIGSRS